MLAVLFYNVHAAYSALATEYLSNGGLREMFAEKGDTMTQLIAIAALGPETVLLLSVVSMRPRGTWLGPDCELALRTAAIGSHVVQDIPLLIVNALYHYRTGAAWDVTSILLLGMGAASLLAHLPYRVAKAIGAHKAVAAENDTGLSNPTSPMIRASYASHSRGSSPAKRRSISASPEGRRAEKRSAESKPLTLAEQMNRKLLEVQRGTEKEMMARGFDAEDTIPNPAKATPPARVPPLGGRSGASAWDA